MRRWAKLVESCSKLVIYSVTLRKIREVKTTAEADFVGLPETLEVFITDVPATVVDFRSIDISPYRHLKLLRLGPHTLDNEVRFTFLRSTKLHLQKLIRVGP